MTRKILGSLFAALLLSPAAAFAAPRHDAQAPRSDATANQNLGQIAQPKSNVKQPAVAPNSDNASNGTGMTFGNDPGHVASPSRTQVDPDTRGPLDDVQPGTPESSDTHQARHPKPARYRHYHR